MSSQSLKSYIIVNDLYRMFHVKQSPYQIRIILFFKRVIESMRNSKRNIHSINKNIIKVLISFLTFSATSKRKISLFILRKSMNWNFKRYVSDLSLKMTSKKRFENILHIASFLNETTASTRFNYYDVHIKISISRCRNLKESWRWRSIVFDRCFFKKNDI